MKQQKNQQAKVKHQKKRSVSPNLNLNYLKNQNVLMIQQSYKKTQPNKKNQEWDYSEDEIYDAKPQQTIEQENNVDVDAKISEMLEGINLNLLPRFQKVSIDQSNQLLPVVLQIQINKLKHQHQRANIDLVCVVDVSGSMEGQKIKLVMDSLRYVQKILNENDRISIVTFSSKSKVELSWTRNTQENKAKIKQAILGMKIIGSTNITSGVKKGLKLIKFRKQKNPVTCMFVLSDGQDNHADQRIAKKIEQYDIYDSFVIHTFGYGKDHDPKVMNNIANLKGGTFKFIENIELSTEHFILSMSGMLSVVVQNAILTIEESPEFKIPKIFGDDYKLQEGGQNTYIFDINYLLQGESIEFALLLQLPSIEHFVNKPKIVLKAKLKGNLIEYEQEFSKEEELSLILQQEASDEKLQEIVEVSYLRAKSGDIIGQAQKLASQRKYEQARQLLDEMISEIQRSPFIGVKGLIVVMNDLQQLKEVCMPKQFEDRGQALMLNKKHKHAKKQKARSQSSDWNSDEEENLNNYKQGRMQLSCSEEDIDQKPLSKKRMQNQRRRSSSIDSSVSRRKRKYSGSRSRSRSGDSRQSPQRIIFVKKNRKRSSSPNRRRYHSGSRSSSSSRSPSSKQKGVQNRNTKGRQHQMKRKRSADSSFISSSSDYSSSSVYSDESKSSVSSLRNRKNYSRSSSSS